MFLCFTCLVLCALSLPSDTLAPWGSFRGPNGSGVGPAETLPRALDPERNLAWKVDLEPGYSSPVVTEFSVLLTVFEDRKLLAVCLDRDSGDLFWKAEGPAERDAGYRGPNTPVSSTPATDGDCFYVLYSSFGLVAYDLEGEELWRRELGPFNVPHTISASPVLYKDMLLMLCDQDTSSFLVALDKATGEERWRTSRPGVTHGYSSPILYQPSQGPAQALVSGAFQLVSYDVTSGEKLWWVNGLSWQSITLPVLAGDRVFVHSSIGPMTEYGAPTISGTFAEALEEKDRDGDRHISREEWPHEMLQQLWFLYDLDNDELIGEEEWEVALARGQARGGLFAIDPSGGDDLSESVRWTYTDKRGMPGFASPLLYQDVLYVVKDGGILTAMDPATGKVLKQGRVGGEDAYFASPIAAAGKLILADRAGRVSVVQAGANWELLSTSDFHEEIWSTPAVCEDRVFVRTQKGLYCFEAALEE